MSDPGNTNDDKAARAKASTERNHRYQGTIKQTLLMLRPNYDADDNTRSVDVVIDCRDLSADAKAFLARFLDGFIDRANGSSTAHAGNQLVYNFTDRDELMLFCEEIHSRVFMSGDNRLPTPKYYSAVFSENESPAYIFTPGADSEHVTPKKCAPELIATDDDITRNLPHIMGSPSSPTRTTI
jgi:hypothetical protein